MTEKKEKDKTCFYGFGCFQVNILPSKVLSGKCLYIVYFGVYNMHTGNIYIIYIGLTLNANEEVPMLSPCPPAPPMLSKNGKRGKGEKIIEFPHSS